VVAEDFGVAVGGATFEFAEHFSDRGIDVHHPLCQPDLLLSVIAVPTIQSVAEVSLSLDVGFSSRVTILAAERSLHECDIEVPECDTHPAIWASYCCCCCSL
jgi:hypothetical protein